MEGMHRLDELLRQRLREKGLERPLRAHGVCEAFDLLARESLGAEAPVGAISFKDGRLKVEVRGSVWASELRLRSPEIQRVLNSRLKEAEVREIKLIVR